MKQKPLIFTLAALAAAGSSTFAENWKPASTGALNWNDTANWTPATIPNNNTKTPSFGSSPLRF